MKFLLPLLLVAIITSSYAEDTLHIPDTPAPYGLTWQQFWKIKASAVSRNSRLERGEDRARVNAEIGAQMNDEMVGFAEMLFDGMDEANAKGLKKERERVQEFCIDVEALEDTTSLLDPYIAANFADTYPRIAKAELLLTANGMTDEISTNFMRENYPGLWLINKAWVYCRVKI